MTRTERVAEVLLKTTGPLLARRWRINLARNIAQAMLDAAVAGMTGEHTIESAELA